jgi:hypothetical protein
MIFPADRNNHSTAGTGLSETQIEAKPLDESDARKERACVTKFGIVHVSLLTLHV